MPQEIKKIVDGGGLLLHSTFVPNWNITKPCSFNLGYESSIQWGNKLYIVDQTVVE